MNDKGLTEGDWRLFRRKLPEWQETYMDRLTREYIQLLSDSRAPSEKFWELDRRIKEDKRSAGVSLDVRRSTMLGNIVRLLNEGVIAMDDLDCFSDELKDAVRFVSGKADSGYMINADMVYDALDEAIDAFRSVLDADFDRRNIIIQLFDETNKCETFEAFCKEYFSYRLSDPYRNKGYFDFLASAFIGKENGGIDGILVRTDVAYKPGELKHTMLHELAHIYCVHNELGGEDFYDLYCNGTASTAEEDGIINAGYAIWRECIAEVIAIELDNACYIASLGSKKKYLSSLIEKIEPVDGKLAMSMILTAVMTSREIEDTKEWLSVEKSIARLKLFEEPMFHDMFKKVFEQLRNGFCEISYDYIFAIGSIYLNLLAVQTVKNCKLFDGSQGVYDRP